jgi:hypothetical protein
MIELYIGSNRLDTYKDEDISITLNIQNIKDISKLFVDFTQNFSVPATAANNKAFKHYYNADVSGGFQASLRQDATLFLNKELFREGTIELLGVNLEQGKASSYEVVFFSAGVNLKDLFGEDELTSLDLSAYDHAYDGAVIRGAMEGTTPLHSGNIIYPLISPVGDWHYDSSSSNHNEHDIAYHSQNDNHGLDYYELKPAIKLSKIIDAIEAKYGITFTSTFFSSSKFTDLFMWCHRREGYMFLNQKDGFTAQKIDFTAKTGSFNLSDDTTTNAVGNSGIIWEYSILSADDYQVHFFVNGVYETSRSHSGQVSFQQVYISGLKGGDKVQMRFSPPVDWDGSSITLGQVICEGRTLFGNNFIFTCERLTTQTFATDVNMSNQMPEQKVYDFITGLVKMFNLVIESTSRTKFIVEPLDDWYALGTTHDITQYTDTTSLKVNKPELYKRISLKYQESDTYEMRNHRLTNGGVGYGDIRTDFTFDGGELTAENSFEIMRYQKLNDLSGGVTNFLVGKSIDKEGGPYIGAPVIFYSPSTLNISSYPIGFLDETGLTTTASNQVYLCANINNRIAASVTQMLSYGLEVDPFHEQSFSQTLYNQFWEDYITDLYSTSRRVYSLKARLPTKVLTALRLNDKLDISGRRYIINQVKVNLTTNEATLELLNDV